MPPPAGRSDIEPDGRTMISLFPEHREEQFDPAAAVAAEDRPATGARSWVMTNMIASADGATAVDGLSGALGSSGDKAMFMALRAVADGIVVGASTVREERYRPPSGGDAAARAVRVSRGQAERPLLAVITGSLGLDADLPLFGDDTYRPLIVTVENAPPDRRERLAEVADIVDAGEDRVDLEAALAILRGRGLAVVLSEGGPSLNGQLIADDLIDEWNLSISPVLASGESPRPAVCAGPVDPPARMRLARVWEQEQLLFCRWVRSERRT